MKFLFQSWADKTDKYIEWALISVPLFSWVTFGSCKTRPWLIQIFTQAPVCIIKRLHTNGLTTHAR